MAHRHLFIAAACAAALVPCLLSQKPEVKRPAILGVAHITLKTNDLAAAREFYGRYLGLEQAGMLVGSGIAFKVNYHQSVEITDTLRGDEDRLDHVAFETADARGLREYLAVRGVKVPAELKPDA